MNHHQRKKLLSCSTILLSVFFVSTSRDTLTPTLSLSVGETLVSARGTFALGFFTPKDSDNDHRYVGIWYNNIPNPTVIWVANRRRPLDGTTGELSITGNGALLITDKNSTVIWSSASSAPVANPTARLLDTGNFVVAGENGLGSFAWQSFDYPTDTLIPGMKLGSNLASGLSRNLTSWSSPTDPSPGDHSLTLDLRGDPQLKMWNGSAQTLRSGPWNGIEFTGLDPYNASYDTTGSYKFVNNEEEVYCTMREVTNNTLARLVVDQSGALQRFVWLDSGEWSLYWYAPRTRCDRYLPCGPYGSVCSQLEETPMCSCLPGFLPRFPANWALRDWTGGCIRKTKLDCRNGTDGFVMIQQNQLPDTVRARVDMTMSLDECKVECLRICSCTAVARADIRGQGSGCIIWSTNISDVTIYSDGGQDFYMRLASADIGVISSERHKNIGPKVAVILCIVLGAVFLLVSAICCARRKQKRTGGNTLTCEESVPESTEEDDMELPLFDLLTIAAATNNFSNENKLGEGGFGPVYKGKMREGQEIAAKRLSKTSVQGLDELKTEVMLVAKLQHRNLVRLLGCCIQGDERIIIYEYMPNKSLDAFLFDEEKVLLLDWATRHHIILGIARGLLYLHRDSRFRIIHRDLKAGNVLLDKDMNPKISDFGLARIFGGDETKTKTSRVVGTYGYMSPEYALNGIFSVKSDVFSFGVLVLEIISGKRNRGVYLSEAEEYLLGKAWALWKEGSGLQLVDKSLNDLFLRNEVLRCMKVGLLCVQDCPEDRPTMSSVVSMLGSDYTFLPEPERPGFLARLKSPEGSSSSMQENSTSINGVTITMCIARE